jgi:hypothetical protein
MFHEIRLRVPRSFYITLSAAAAARGVAVSALVSLAAHEFLHSRGELAPTQVGAKTPPTIELDADISEWLAGEEEPLDAAD